MKWKVARATMIGRTHQMTNTKCQDFICQQPSDDFICVVAADGSGSAMYSLEGAHFVAEETRDILFERGDTLFELNDDEIRHVILQNLDEKLRKMANERGCPVDEFASTLSFFASNGNDFIVGNLGDGLIGYKDSTGAFCTLLNQERGKYANVSYFVTGDNSKGHLRIKRGSFSTSHVYFIMTDGTVECLYNKRTRSYANALSVYCGLLDKYEHMQINNALTTSMYKLFPSRTNDDCALAIIMGKNG